MNYFDHFMGSGVGIFFTSFVVGLSGAMMPGPVLIATIEAVVRRGFVAGPLIVLGHGLLEVCVVVAVVAGLNQVLAEPIVLAAVGVIGGIALLWMGAGIAVNVRKAKLNLDAPAPQKLVRRPIVAGIITSAVNPYWVLWWATIGLTYIARSLKLGEAGPVYFYSGHILSDLAWYSLVAVSIAMSRRLVSDRAYRVVLTICALSLIVFGLYFGYGGVKTLAATSGGP